MDLIVSILFNVNLRAAEIRVFFSTSLLPWLNHLQSTYAVVESLWLAWSTYDQESWVQFLQEMSLVAWAGAKQTKVGLFLGRKYSIN